MSVNALVAPSSADHASGSGKPSDKKEKEKEKEERVHRVDQYYSRNTRQVRYEKTSKEDKTREKFRKYTLVIRRIIGSNGLLQDIQIDIKSTELAAILKDHFRDAETLKLAESDTTPKISPDALFLAWDHLENVQAEEKRKQPPNIQLVDDLSVVLAYLERDHGDKRSRLKGLLADGLISFELLGHIFAPNSALYSEKNELQEGQVMRFASGSYEQTPAGKKFYLVHASLITHDGQCLGWAKTAIQLPAFEGNMPITDLNVFPFDQHPQRDAIQQQLKSRGHDYLGLLGEPVCKWYQSTAIYSKREFGIDNWEEIKFLAQKRVMIDPPGWMVHNHSRDILRRPTVPGKKSFLQPQLVAAEDLMFCNHRILGFSFEAKLWGVFAVSKLQTTEWNETAFSKVIAPPGQIALIHDLVISHQPRTEANGDATADMGNHEGDIIKGKGQGLIGLLSGRPGVGKTLTAEAVAEVAQKPLYAVSAGEMGAKVDMVDQRLGLVLDIAHRWRCVLLIDEADIFLRKRDDDISLERNAVVSAFLRRLEYFQGLAILTTNREIDIDVAFMSRIHFKFHYEDLDSQAMFRIWKNFLAEETTGPTPNIKEAELQQLVGKYTLSGREIKNAVLCAKSICRARHESLSINYLEGIIENLGFPVNREQQARQPLAKGELKHAGSNEQTYKILVILLFGCVIAYCFSFIFS